jgi:hypothetical protein
MHRSSGSNESAALHGASVLLKVLATYLFACLRYKGGDLRDLRPADGIRIA